MAGVYAVVMAGGRGERFWPLSTDEIPKPFVQLLGSATLFQDTVARLESWIPGERIFVSLGESHARVAREQVPQIPKGNFIVEPVGRDTAACLGYCALHLERIDQEAVMLALPADHFVADARAFQCTVEKGLASLSGASGIVFGMIPTRPDTGYGYIQAERPPVSADAWPVVRFVEKPDAARAEQYCKSGDFFWNSGIFLWRNRTLLELFANHMPKTWEGLNKLRPLIGREDTASERLNVFSGLERISIDFGIIEKASGLRMVPASFPWDDIGNWEALERALPADESGNVSRGAFSALDSSGCITYSDAGVVAAFGVRDLVIVQAHGKVLVCPKNRGSDLKKLAAVLSKTR